MSDLTLPQQLSQQSAFSQLSVDSYFDEALFKLEQQTLFQNGPRYVGHRLAAPNPGDFYTLPQENAGRALIHGKAGIELVSNVCRHRQALILQGKGSIAANASGGLGNLVCPLHNWTYDTSGQTAGKPMGQLIAAPHFVCDPDLHLHNYKLQEWNGLLFEDNGRNVAADMAQLGPRADLDFSGYKLDHVEMHECNYNWKTFIEVYLEDYHVGPFHPGLGNFVTTGDLQWEFKPDYSVQTVGVANRLGHAGSAIYERWQTALLQHQQDNFGGKPPKYGAIWLTYHDRVVPACSDR